MAKCIITGCQLAIEGIEYYWGDLHEQGDQFIFYCIQKTPLVRGYDSNTVKEVAMGPYADRFERGGVWIFPREQVTLNKAAMEYITPSRPVAADAPAEVANLPTEYRKALAELAASQEMSETQVLRAAIRLYQAERHGSIKITHTDERMLAAPVEVQGAPYTDGAFLVPGVPLPALPCTEFRLWYPGNTTGCAGYTAQAMAAHAAHYGQAVAKALAGRPTPSNERDENGPV